MNRRKKLKCIPFTTLAIMLISINSSGISIYANEVEENKSVSNINLLNVGNIDNINERIDKDILFQDKVIISNIKNIYPLASESNEINDFDNDSYEEETSNEIPVIAANLISTIDNSLLYEPYIIKQVDEAKVGIIGIVSKENELNTPSNIIIENEIESINKYTKELVEQGIENIVVLTDMTSLLTEFDDNTLNDMKIENNTYVEQSIDNEVDIIISENEINGEIKSINIQRENNELLLIQSNENTIVDINLSINKENNKIENKNVNFINNEDITHQEDEIINPEENTEVENNLDDSEDIDENDNLDNTQIQPYVVGGTTNSNNQTPPSNNNSDEENKQEDNKDDKDETEKDSTNKEDNEDKEDKDEDKEESKDDESDKEDKENNENDDKDVEDEEEDDDKDEEDDKESSINPKTGDSSMFMYIIGCIGATIGLSINKGKKE
ncbi:MAG: hypothetical protein ACRDD7_09870 [Peptostreptococcaceae bacterium]